jgi:hypothetical protein
MHPAGDRIESGFCVLECRSSREKPHRDSSISIGNLQQEFNARSDGFDIEKPGQSVDATHVRSDPMRAAEPFDEGAGNPPQEKRKPICFKMICELLYGSRHTD